MIDLSKDKTRGVDGRMIVKEYEISPRPASIKHNFPVVNHDAFNFDKDVPRYLVYSTTMAYSWEIVDRGAFDAKGNPCVRSTFKSKADWSPSDIYSFLSYLNIRQ